jgi:predicted amidohydrolase YtcJ
MLALALFAATAAHADTTVFRGGAVYTLDAAHPWASGLVVVDGRVAYVGSDQGAKKYERPGARLIALHGRMILPGFHDGHTHPMSGAMRLLRCKLGGLRTAAAIGDAVRACAVGQKGAWLLGAGWSPAAFGPEGPTVAALDALVPDRPAYLTTEDGFTGWANSKALAIAGVAATGALPPDKAQSVRRHVPPPSEAQYREALRRASAIANRFGITSVFDAAATPAMLDAYHDADLAGELTLRVVAAQLVNPLLGPDQVDDMIARRDRVQGPRFRADAAKIFLDEEISLHTAAMIEPYADAPTERGRLFVRQPAFDAIVRRLDAEGFLIHMHVMGDLAVRTGLDAIEHAIAANGPRDRRHQLAHVGVADAADIPRFGELGVAANFTPLWAQSDDPAFAATQIALGPERSRRMHPIASIAAGGGRIVAGSDWMSTSMNPLDSVRAAATRSDGQRVSLAAILAAYTKDAAWAAREDTTDGTLAAGKAADLIVLDRNLFKRPAAWLNKAHVLLTLLDGKPVYRDPSFSWR